MVCRVHGRQKREDRNGKTISGHGLPAVRGVPELTGKDLLFVDVQAVGSPDSGFIMEIAWKKPCGPVHCFRIRRASAEIPARVVSLTGITAEMLQGPEALRETEVRFLFTAASQGRTLVAHHSVYEKKWLDRLTGLDLPFICTRKLARESVPDLRSGTLRAVAGLVGHQVSQRRTACGHVLATEAVYNALVTGFTSRIPRRSERLSLPAEPGVYRLLDSTGRVIYVGKAGNLRARLSGHFTGRDRGRHAEMISRTASIAHEVCETALHAAVLESELISDMAPEYNIAGKSCETGIWYLDRSMCLLTDQNSPGAFGPFVSPGPVDLFADLVRLITSGEDPVDFVENIVPGADPDLVRILWPLWREEVLESGIVFRALRIFQDQQGQERGKESEEDDREKVRDRLNWILAEGMHRCRIAAAIRLLSGCSLSWQGKTGSGIVHKFVDNTSAADFDQRSVRRLRVLLAELKRLCRKGKQPELRTKSGAVLNGDGLERLVSVL